MSFGFGFDGEIFAESPGSSDDQQADTFGQISGDGHEDVALEGGPHGSTPGDSKHEHIGAVGYGEVEDGVGHIAADAVEESEWDPCGFAFVLEVIEEVEGILVFVQGD